MRTLRLSARSAVCFAAVTVLLLVLAVTSAVGLNSLYKAEQDVETNWMASIAQTAKMDTLVLRLRLETLRMVASEDDQMKQTAAATIAQTRGQLQKEVAAYQALVASPEEQRLADAVSAGVKAYDARLDEIVAIARTRPASEGTAYVNANIRPLTNDLQEKIVALADFNQRGAKQAGELANQTYSRNLWLLGVISAVAVVLTVVLAVLYTRSILQPLRQVLAINKRIAEGDLRVSVVAEGRDEMADLMRATVQMQQTLRDTVSHIGEASTQLASAAEEMNAVTEEASRGLQRQNGEVEQAAAAVNEMTAAVEEVARNAASASTSAQQSERSTGLGAARVTETVNAINSLTSTVSHTSEQIVALAGQAQGIATVVDVIRGIAEQTNLLALNAAIEAARAGEQGRGFAVVADEVRALAHRTQESTREIEQMIGGIQSGSEGAVQAMQRSRDEATATLKIAHEAGAALEEIARSITEINERNFLIATASEEQAQVARSVDQNLVSIRDLSIQTSAGAHQTAAAAHEVSRLAVDMNRLVGRFSV
ncbi:methyl-accepting chemotaxis protein [Pseudomonas oryzihabitans]|uniref:Methyl-accepting chemotaxis protein n=1 Tax=Pseudomonas oryzihabitans TaxID=47885 RepID=A0A1G5M6Z8_9PSED|nr:methyl-accepting chemotaxis protein [Pseudomonas psychrotolerans]NMY88765.1 methyl-accepting chemotaxis protein [Pseudomonas psychrotolerans]SCZ20220.1 methyl-accepting chemotaxis protein [Pseudomonas psychrotolerans]